ncbi:MAG: tol-pal system protein YbgF [Legionella sp.]|nr:tol-pal system protein YbgF [Legionella sp.]
MGLSCFLALPTFAEAPVVDESENYALFDEQLAATEQPDFPLAQAQTVHEEERIALAFDDTPRNEIPEDDDATLFDKLQSMQQEVNNLRGQLEVQTHEIQVLKQQQLDFYKDLDARLRDPNTTASNSLSQTAHPITEQLQDDQETEKSSPLLATENSAPRGNPADEQISYLAAYELIKNKEFDKAVMAMNSFIRQYPRGGYTANAHYWLGELYMVKKAYPDAIEQFKTVLKIFPSSSKTSDCSLKIGYALLASGQKNVARQQLQNVIRDYPDTHAAELAARKLENINS